MTDFATLGIKFESSGIVDAERKLTKLGSTGKQTETKLGGLSVSGNKLSSSFKAADTQTSKLTSSLDASNSKASLLSGTMGKLSGVFAGLGLASLASDAFSTYRSFESMNASLKTVTGSAEAAGAAFKEISEFAKTTPYTLDQSVQGFQKLKALGLDPSMTSLKSYGNTAAAMGKDLMQMIEAVADASTFEFERLKEFGIKSKQEGDNVSFTFQGVTTTVKKNSEEIQKYLLDIGNTQFATAMSDQMATIDGKIANLSDSYAALQVKLMQSGGADIAAASIETLSSVIQSITDNTREWTIAIGVLSAVILKSQVANILTLIGTQYQLVKSTYAAATAQTVFNRSTGIMTGSVIAQTGKVGLLTLAMNGLRGILAIVGGPLGLLAIAAGTAYAYRQEISELTDGTYRAKRAEELRNTTLSEVIRLNNESVGASSDVIAKKKEEVQATMTQVQAELLLIKTRAQEARSRATDQKERTAKILSGDVPDNPIVNDLMSRHQSQRQTALTASAEAYAKAAEAATNEEEKQLALVKEIQDAIDNFGVKKITYAPIDSGSGNNGDAGNGGYVPPKPPTVTGGTGTNPKISDASREDKLLIDSLRTAQEKFNDKIKDYDERLASKRITQETYNRAVAAAKKELADATEKTEKLTAATGKQTEAERYRLQVIEQTRTAQEKRDNDIAEAEKMLSGDANKELLARRLKQINAEYEQSTKSTRLLAGTTKTLSEAERERLAIFEQTRTAFEKYEAAKENVKSLGLDSDTEARKLAQLKAEYDKHTESVYKNSEAYKANQKAIEDKAEADKKNATEHGRINTLFTTAAEKIGLFTARLTKSKEGAEKYALSLSEKLNPAQTDGLYLLQQEGNALEKNYNLREKVRSTIADLAKEQKLLNVELLKGKEAAKIEAVKQENEGISDAEARAIVYKQNDIELTRKQISLRGTAADLIKEQNTALYKSNLLTTQGANAVRLYELAQQGLNEKQSLAYVENEKRLTQSEKMRESISNFQDGFTDALIAGEDSLKSFFATMIQQAAQAQLQLSLFGESGTGGLLGGLFSSSSSSGGLSSIVSSIFGGFRANGGSVSSSKAYVVGEEGPELFVPTGNGSIVSNGALSSSGSTSTNVTVNLIEDASKAGTTESSTMNGQQIIDVFVSNIRAGGQAASAIESTYKMKRAGAF